MYEHEPNQSVFQRKGEFDKDSSPVVNINSNRSMNSTQLNGYKDKTRRGLDVEAEKRKNYENSWNNRQQNLQDDKILNIRHQGALGRQLSA
jgi:hypothetical protein